MDVIDRMCVKKRAQKKSILIVAIVFVSLCAHQALAQIETLGFLFNPVANLDVAGTYDRYSSLVDFLLYLVLFVGVAQSKLAGRFTGRSGKAVVIAVGLILSVALSSSPFTIGRMWPVASVILILSIMSVIYSLLARLLGSHVLSLATSFIAAYFFARIVFPDYFSGQWANLFHGLFYLATLTLILTLLRVMFPGDNKKFMDIVGRVGKQTRAFNKEFLTRKQQRRSDSELRREEEIIKKLERITKSEEKDSSQIIKDLKDIKRVIEKYGNSSKAGKLISEKIQDILPRKHAIENKLTYLKEMTSRLEQFDISLFNRLKNSYDALTSQQKTVVREELEQEVEKLGAEKEIISQLAPLTERYHEAMQKYLSGAIKQLTIHDTKLALHWINEAIKHEQSIRDLSKKTRSLERLIRTITEKEFQNTIF